METIVETNDRDMNDMNDTNDGQQDNTHTDDYTHIVNDGQQQSGEDNNNNNEEEEDGNESSDDFMKNMYGNEEVYELDDEEEDNNEEQSATTNAPVLDLSATNIVNTSQVVDSATQRSHKRSSDEFIESNNQNKRIKSEPTDKPKSVSNNRLTTTCDAIEMIPMNIKEFMTYLLDLNGNDLESKDSNISMEKQLQDISKVIKFDSHEELLTVFIPYILTDLWLKMKREYSMRAKNNSKHCSVLTKWRSDKTDNGLEMKCISIFNPEESPFFKFGQLIVFQTAVQLKPNSVQHSITRKKYLAYVNNHSIRKLNSENQSEMNHLRLFKDYKVDSVLVEELSFVVKCSEELFLRNDALIVAEPIICAHYYISQARAAIKLQSFPICKQIFNPIFHTKRSGIVVNVNEMKFDLQQIECIQMAFDVVTNSSENTSDFFLIKSTDKTHLLSEIGRQIALSEVLKGQKVLITSSYDSSLKKIEDILKSKKLKTYKMEDHHFHLNQYAIKNIKHKLTKDIDDNKKALYEQCLVYLETSAIQSELSVESALILDQIYNQVKNDLMNTCSVIIGRIDLFSNDRSFYTKFANNSKSKFNCCLIDDSATISETQLYSLFWYGINKFIFATNSFDTICNKSDIFVSHGLSRSLCQRYYDLFSTNKSNTNESTIYEFTNDYSITS